MSKTGLSFKKLDLHVHTPASKDFDDKSVTPQQIVKAAIDAGLDAIAITDHNSGAWVDKVKEAAKGSKLIVFPGVEISCQGGKSGIHIIALFDIDRGSAHVSGLLSSLNITPQDQGKTESLAKGTITEIIEQIQSDKWQGIAIPAHVTSSKGILEDMRGEQRTQVIQHPELIAVEATCFQKDNRKKCRSRAADLLDGNDPTYQRKLAVYQASDNPSHTDRGGHGLAGIGRRCSYFKMEQINLESLRQCFLDPDVRIVQDFEYDVSQYPRIERVRISGGFLDGQDITFHEGLNSVVGGKGTGKSLLVELLRFGLDQSPSHGDLKNDHDCKLMNRLGQGGHVEITFVDVSGNPKTVRRIYDTTGSRYEDTVGEPSFLYPVLFLSQNEIIDIAVDSKRQLAFIDRFLDFRSFQDKVKSVETDLQSRDRALVDSIRAVKEVADLENRIATNSEELERLSARLSAPIFEEHKEAKQKAKAIDNLQAEMRGIGLALKNARTEIDSAGESQVKPSEAEDTTVSRIQASVLSTRQRVISVLDELLIDIGESATELENSVAEKRNDFDEIQRRYDNHVRSEGGDYQKLAGENQQLEAQRGNLSTDLQNANARKDRLGAVRQDRNIALDRLAEIYEEFRAERDERCKFFTDKSDGSLQLSIESGSDTREFRSRLLSLKTGSHIRETDIDVIVERCSPRFFVDGIIDYCVPRDSSTGSLESEALSRLSNECGLDLDKVLKLASILTDEDKIEQLLALQYRAYPQDRPEIELKVGEGKYSPLDSLSVGQKSTALLIMALTDGDTPVVIDQPEDSLDIRSIWEEICSKVRLNKSQRQFIFTTHNSNVAVASDSDNFIIMDADSEKGWVVEAGSMDHEPVDNEVLRYMEGEAEPYGKKFRKYGADRRPELLSR